MEKKINFKKEIKLSRLQLILIIAIILIISLIGFYYYNNGLNNYINILYKKLTNQINIEKEIQTNEIILGITDVTGNGIIINVLDGNDLIHQEDLIILLDELKNAGSQAISINDIRITNQTYLYCDGSVILIDGEKIGNPFVIKAIGNSQTLYGAITRNKGYISTLKRDGLEINIEKSDNIIISKTNKSDLLNYGEDKNLINKLIASNNLIGKNNMIGKGLEIVIYENKIKLSALSFLQIINDLKVGGAKAISINDNRITNLTDIMDITNNYVLVNSIPISAPYTIKVIGNQDMLKENLNYSNSYINKIKAKGNTVEIYDVSRINVIEYQNKRDKNKMNIEYLKEQVD